MQLTTSPSGEKPTVVLVHGAFAESSSFNGVIDRLLDAGFPVVAAANPLRGVEIDSAYLAGILDGIEGSMILVGHSYGGIGVLCAAARRPEATRSLTMLEPATFVLGQDDPAGRALVEGVRAGWDSDAPDDEWVVTFLKAIGSDPDEFPPEFLDAAVPLVPLIRNGRPLWSPDLPLQAVADGDFPKLVVSGGHHAGFEAICDDLAERIGAAREVVEGAGHEVQFTGPPLNELLRALWRASASITSAR